MGVGIVREFGMDVYTLLYLKCITNQDLLGTGNSVQHRELCSMSRGRLAGTGVWERMDAWMCMAEALCCPPVTIMML